MSFKYISSIVFLVLFVIVSTLLWIGLSQDDFIDNLVPELIGFCLEGIFFIGLLSVWQQRRERRNKRSLSKSLRGFLGVFLKEINSGIICASFSPLEKPDELDQAHEGIDKLKLNITNCSISQSSIDALHRLSLHEISSLVNLLPVAAELSAKHMIRWNDILNQVKLLASTEQREDIRELLLALLDNIKSFDGLEI
jgi:hypothetical protein